MAYRLSKTTAAIATRIPIPQAEAVRAAAKAREQTVSDVVAVLIEREFGAVKRAMDERYDYDDAA